MPASYVHQCVAADALEKWTGKSEKISHNAVIAGSEGPDPLFFSFVPKKGHQSAPEVANLLHKEKTSRFLSKMAENAGQNDLLKSFVYGFMAHYATDTVCHPYIYTKSFNEDGSYNGNKHCKFEHALDVYLYRTQGHSEGVPDQMAGYASLTAEESDEIAGMLAESINEVFPEHKMTAADVRQSFKDSVSNTRKLKREALKSSSLLLGLTKLTPYAGMIDSHVMPNEPLSDFVSGSGYSVSGYSWDTINNSAHNIWYSYWEPERARTESFEELYVLAVDRTVGFMQDACDYFEKRITAEQFAEVMGDMSYDSGIYWAKTKKF